MFRINKLLQQNQFNNKFYLLVLCFIDITFEIIHAGQNCISYRMHLKYWAHVSLLSPTCATY